MGPAGERAEHGDAGCLIRGLAENPAALDDGRVGRQHGTIRSAAQHRDDRLRLFLRQAVDVVAWPLAGARAFIDVGRHDLVSHADLVKELAASRGRRGEDNRVVTH